MSGVNDLSVGEAMKYLVWLATSTRPNEDPSKPFTPQCSSWQHIIASRYSDHYGDEGTTPQELLAFNVPQNCYLIICYVGIQTAPRPRDVLLGETPSNGGDFRSNLSINPYGLYGNGSASNPSIQIVDQTGGALTPDVPSCAIQGQQIILPVPAGTTARLMVNFNFINVNMLLRVQAWYWGFLVPSQVANRLQDFKTNWFVQAADLGST
jgi:hypothetical protein